VFDLTGTDVSVSGDLNPAGYDFLQVVIPKGTMVFLNGSAVVDGALMAFDPVQIGTPEPGTIVMLLVGALCALGIRRR